jgi:PAS domain S-box-containing protein
LKQERKILFIDSDRKYRERAKNAFLKCGYHYILCTSGTDGLNKIIQEKPDVVITSAKLPDLTGEEIYSRFLLQFYSKSINNIPFIILVENGEVDRSKLYNMGFSACLGKPFRAKELLEFVEDVIVSHQIKMEEIYCWETIREAKDFLERVVESSIDSIITTDRRGIITYCNRASEEILGYSFEEMVGKRVSEFLFKGNSELLRISSYLTKRSKLQNYKTIAIGKNKRKIPINLSVTTMNSGNGKIMGALGISKVIHGKNFSEYDTNESDRLASVVETAIAVNHAINNPLVPILGNAQFLLQDERFQDDDIRRRLRIIVKNALRIRDITQKLASITHPVTKEYLKGTRMLDIDAST